MKVSSEYIQLWITKLFYITIGLIIDVSFLTTRDLYTLETNYCKHGKGSVISTLGDYLQCIAV